MKTKLIVELIKSHFKGDESFYNSVNALVDDEERKGNVGTATEIREAFIGASIKKNRSRKEISKGSTFSLMSLPADTNNKLDLFELIYPNQSFADIVLEEKAIGKLKEVVKERKKIKSFEKNGIQLTNRVLFYGPPGCGKTLAAKVLASELNLPIAYVRLDGLISSFLGETSVNLRKVFNAVNNQEIVLFLDEFDAIAKKRDDAQELGELKRVVTSLLQNFDSLSSSVVLIAATNHPQLLDPAIWRRFNSVILIDYPSVNQRKTLFNIFLKKYNVKHNLDIDSLSKITEGMSCSNIEEFVTELRRKQIVDEIKCLEQTDFINALINVMSNYSNDNGFWKTIKTINEKGVSLREISKAIGVPYTTISYKIGGLSNE